MVGNDNLRCLQNKNRTILGNDCNTTTGFELVKCSEQIECLDQKCDVCLKFRIYHDTGKLSNPEIIKSCGHSDEKLTNITDGSCKRLSNEENWEIKKEIVEEWKQYGSDDENTTEKFDNQTTRCPQSIIEEPHCWDKFATSKRHFILEACECYGNGTGCNGAPKLSMPSSYHIIFIIVMIVTCMIVGLFMI